MQTKPLTHYNCWKKGRKSTKSEPRRTCDQTMFHEGKESE